MGLKELEESEYLSFEPDIKYIVVSSMVTLGKDLR